jgi:hypothetical protein
LLLANEQVAMILPNGQTGDSAGPLAEILEIVKQLRAEVDQINGRLNILASLKEVKTREHKLHDNEYQH